MTTQFAVDSSTISAVATPPGRGGIGIIRLSGPLSLSIAEAITDNKFTPRHAHFCQFKDTNGAILDAGIGLFFPGPQSFTGEDVVELQAHGGPIVLDLILKECFRHGARPSKPGEFSERAYLNDKIDLAQAEAIADLINSTTEQAAFNAAQSLQGAFSNRINTLTTAVTKLRVYVEAAIDFPEEEIDFISEGRVKEKLEEIINLLHSVHLEASQGRIMQEGLKAVIAGNPNAGKSSLLNALSGHDTAIVTATAGTTRDILREHIQIEGMPLQVVDTAGFHSTADEIELEGMRRASQEMETADRILLIIDSSAVRNEEDIRDQPLPEQYPILKEDIPVTIILNKCDLGCHGASIDTQNKPPIIHLSAKTGIGMDLLKQHLKELVGFEGRSEGIFSARRRHLDSLQAASEYLQAGHNQLVHAGSPELLADDLFQCQKRLGEITRPTTNDDLLSEIFSSFCIGK
ncbi:MAG: tRNA uridine-5-carboxymethylaminomethyl(34) synthesis GTPase MnmE [Halieaceae bacterium]|jgi:tRNA modification GTPase|nr:tRNA uridine-5-carboxymethylaminomethyl(34) synthesis GTPase MnmE [Halieaceae bacterium]